MQIFLKVDKLELFNLINKAIQISQQVCRVKNEGNLILPMNSFDDYLSWADSTETISRL